MPVLEQQLRLASAPINRDINRLELSIPTIHCGGCIRKIETKIGKLDKVHEARVNLSTKRLSVQWRTVDGPPTNLIDALSAIGFDAHFGTPANDNDQDDGLTYLYRALAVAAFAAMNIMMLSVAVWAGASGESRQLFHWVSAFIAFPALLYSGSYFFKSAWTALRAKQTNMDVPISIGLIVIFAMSLYDTITHQADVYFDAATSLLFFLLVGRTLDHMMRRRARKAVDGLMQMTPKGATRLHDNSATEYIPVGDIRPDMRLIIPAGERIPVNGKIERGLSDIDMSLVSGESRLVRASPGVDVVSGVLNVSQPLTMVVTATATTSFLADIVRLMEVAEQSKSQYRQLADRLSFYYAPFVHCAALLTLLVWYGISGSFHQALTISVSVLIITCPCALALAVPMVQIMASKKLFEAGILMKSGSGLERLNDIDHIIFDKTGTLTLGTPALQNIDQIQPEYLDIATSMAQYSSHPYCTPFRAYTPQTKLEFSHISEVPGCGLTADVDDDIFRFGRADWAIEALDKNIVHLDATVLSRHGQLVCQFEFTDHIRADTRSVINHLQNMSLGMEIISGDQTETVEQIAKAVGIGNFQGAAQPDTKMSRIQSLSQQGKRVLMIGDGINDAPALAVAHASMAPGSAADIGRSVADFVYLNNSLSAVPKALKIAKQSRSLSLQNITIAIVYNMVAVPLACLGLVTPLIAAIAMSTSSVLVIGNSMRLGGSSDAPVKGDL